MPRERFLAHTPHSDLLNTRRLGELPSAGQEENVGCGLTSMIRHRDMPEIAASNSKNAVSFSAFHQHAQRSVVRRHGERLQSRSFGRTLRRLIYYPAAPERGSMARWDFRPRAPDSRFHLP